MKAYMEDRTLEKIRIAGGMQIDKHELDAMDPNITVSYMAHCHDTLRMDMQAFVWGEKKRGRTIKYPADWWQAFKERWFPAWLLKRYPVRKTTYQADFDVTYPDYKYMTDRPVVKVREMRDGYRA